MMQQSHGNKHTQRGKFSLTKLHSLHKQELRNRACSDTIVASRIHRGVSMTECFADRLRHSSKQNKTKQNKRLKRSENVPFAKKPEKKHKTARVRTSSQLTSHKLSRETHFKTKQKTASMHARTHAHMQHSCTSCAFTV